MEKDCLLYFKNPDLFKSFIQEFDIMHGWKIESGLMNNRGKAIEDKLYTKKLRDLFSERDLFRKKVSVAEVVSWLDTFVHLDRIINFLKDRIEYSIYKDIEIVIEYVIEMSKMSRVDCIIKYESRICLIEFRTVNKFDRMKAAFDKKRIELMIYKDLMLNYLEPPTKIVLLPFIGLYEYKEKQIAQKHYENNVKNAQFASNYISRYILEIK